MSIEDTIRLVVREEVRAALDELRARLEPRPAQPVMALLTVEEVAKRVGAKAETVRNWIRAGKLSAQRAGHRFVVTPAALESFLVGTPGGTHTTMTNDEHLSVLMGRVGDQGKRRKR